MDDLILEMNHISKTFPGVNALKDVTLKIHRGEIHSIVGENGAGKSTLMKILAGVIPPTKGELILEGKPVKINNPRHAISLGIILINQELSILPDLTVTENIFLGKDKNNYGILKRHEMREEARRLLDSIAAPFDTDILAGKLSIAQKQQVEIAKALSNKTKILIMDEPTASLSEKETENLFNAIIKLKNKGLTVIFISHRLVEILKISDAVSVLRDGNHIGDLNKEEISEETIVSWMVGRKLTDYYEHDSNTMVVPNAFVVDHYGDDAKTKDISFSVGRGEILGIAGLVGAGRTELCRLIFGIDKKKHGNLYLNGKTIKIKAPKDAIQEGVAYIPEDRKLLGLFLYMPVADNICMNILDDISTLGVISNKKINTIASAAVKNFNIKTPSVLRNAVFLSGGNQQKVLISRWLQKTPKVLILDEPTRGIDVQAKSEIFKLIGKLSLQGVAIIFISSDLTEIIPLSQRILVMRSGKIVAELKDRNEFKQETIIEYATGLRPDSYHYEYKG
ncbi:Ribose import ATP-binding protein RbsA [uncultured spirochete]|uniref:Ribose import ATP-binding protein RbsA n=1 Tax=uncultured spirochete TaxID=156406 RepID=A0A3P3XNX3_9SPIR|nr:Ribose import ATP-binding protein RbsA [uncultured spirochete]